MFLPSLNHNAIKPAEARRVERKALWIGEGRDAREAVNRMRRSIAELAPSAILSCSLLTGPQTVHDGEETYH